MILIRRLCRLANVRGGFDMPQFGRRGWPGGFACNQWVGDYGRGNGQNKYDHHRCHHRAYLSSGIELCYQNHLPDAGGSPTPKRIYH
ncbi:MAG: hypothetical protein K6T99_07180 [Armatimonadetes bacterium]|nr:hypothetical protein [Armatimonadota bacterium]